MPDSVKLPPAVYKVALFCAHFYSIYHCSIYKSIGEVLKFTIAAAHKIDVVGQSQEVYDWAFHQWPMCGVVVMECFLHDLLRTS